MVLPDFPESRMDWREDWPDELPGLIVADALFGCYAIMIPMGGVVDVNIEYLVKIV
jgi:hypothetical protein|tara:strand:- start:427 stop:594 length:168 start_codon:yes stop_codon:yes gene_type:complete